MAGEGGSGNEGRPAKMKILRELVESLGQHYFKARTLALVKAGWKARFPWTHRGQAKARVYLRGPLGRLIFCEGLPSHNLEWYPHLRESDYVLSIVPFCAEEWRFQLERRLLDRLGLSPQRLAILANTQEQVGWAQASGFRSALVNHNCFLDERLFCPNPQAAKLYRAVLNSSPFKFKRPYLAARVEGLAILSHTPYPAALLGRFRQPEYFPQVDDLRIVEVLRRSQVGLCLSAREGACYACSEYLLMGLPVVTTPSQGGREIWYTRRNHLLCQPEPEAVVEAVAQLCREKRNPESIRSEQVALALEHRQRFLQLSAELAPLIGAEVDCQEHFQRHFFHKMSRWTPVDPFIAELAAEA